MADDTPSDDAEDERDIEKDVVEHAAAHPFWRCKCRDETYRMSQFDAELDPYHCEVCDRVWDGRSWFRTMDWYNAIIAWETVNTYVAQSLRRERITSYHGDELEREALDFMAACDTMTHCDVSCVWRLVQAIHQSMKHGAYEQDIRDARHACEPLHRLAWRYAESFPWLESEWDDPDPDTVLRATRHAATSPASEGRYVCLQRKAIDAGERGHATILELRTEYETIQHGRDKHSRSSHGRFVDLRQNHRADGDRGQCARSD